MKDKIKNTKLYVGPMSKNIVDVAIEFKDDVGLIPSRRQIEFDGGYVNGWTTKEFMGYVPDDMIVQRDHAGPSQGKERDDGHLSLRADTECGIKLIHIDPWKSHPSIIGAANETAMLITSCLQYGGHYENLKDGLYFEVGTEEQIRKYTPQEFSEFLSRLKAGIHNNLIWLKIVYGVVQSGTKVQGLANTGQFDIKRSWEMVKICKNHGLIPKEHNSDYLSEEDFIDRLSAGVTAFNVAPELGVLETRTIIEQLNNHSLKEELAKFNDLCYNSRKWEKWLLHKPNASMEDKVLCSGHYVFSNSQFIKEVRQPLKDVCDIDNIIKDKIRTRIKELLWNVKR